MPQAPAPSLQPLEAPRRPELPVPRRFPIIATVAPLAASLVLFAVTRSAFTLVFAALGPVVALASSADAALHRRRTKRHEATRFAADLARVAAQIERAHALERQGLGETSPGAAELLDNPEMISCNWRADPDRDISIRLGVAPLPSELRYNSSDGSGPAASTPAQSGPSSNDRAIEAALESLRDRALVLADAPVILTVRLGIGIIGRSSMASSLARALVLQLAATLSPADWTLTIPDTQDAQWLRELPHGVEVADGGRGIRFSTPGRSLTIVTAGAISDLPRELDVVVELRADGTVHHGAAVVRPGFLGAEEAVAGAEALGQIARRLGIRGSEGSTVPAEVDFRDLDHAPANSEAAVLSAAVGRSAVGQLRLDLATDGPHAVVGGTTGSGKSELLLSWVLGMAAERSPGAVTFLFVDFKGGASFGSLLDLPHSVGLLTDLDTEQSHRALASLAAELRYRERELARLALRTIDQGDAVPFPRLVVVVDEYAALLEAFPTLHALFADIASRGRSLGVHLVLCTQRPAGVVRDAILANAPMRISLRVTNAADSVAVLGSDSAATLPARVPGRALLSIGGDTPVLFQVARCDPSDIARVVDRWAAVPRPRAPWLPPLGARIPLSELGARDPTDDIPFALTDLPHEQAQRPARYRPREQGSLLVVGAGGSGKSGLLEVLEASASTLEVVRV
ncbi:MAG TPA: FtsK/SpoIIIE domain-containing protein, partial [Galbitalea sp.]